MLEYTLIRSHRKTLSIQVLAAGKVLVRAPQRMPTSTIDDFIKRKQQWIQQHVASLATPTAWLAGRPWWHLGCAYSVVIDHSLTQPTVMLHDNQVLISAQLGESNDQISAALTSWQLALAKQLIPDRVSVHIQRLGSLWLPSHVGVRLMRSRWGSCSARRRITLNSALLHMPLQCLDYVICHELAHLKEMNHGPKFYATQSVLNPDWQEQHGLLKQWAKQVNAVTYAPGLP